MLNGVLVHKGVTKYTSNTVDEWVTENSLQPTTDIYLGFGFACTSLKVINSVIDELGRTIDES